MEWFLSGIQEKVTLALGFPMFFPQGGGETHDFHSSPKFFTLANILGVSKNRDTPKSSFLIGFSIINHPFWVFPLFLETLICFC